MSVLTETVIIYFLEKIEEGLLGVANEMHKQTNKSLCKMLLVEVAVNTC
jgi:hypothetical protein